MPSRLRIPLVLVLAAALGGVLVGAPAAAGIGTSAAHADTSDFSFDSFSADYTLSRAADGTSQLDVVETIVARFPDLDQNRGMIRAIPTYYQRVNLETTIAGVVDENGDPVPYTFTDAGDFQELALGDDDYVRGVTTYVISYTSHNVVGSFADTGADEFYWDVNGTGTAQPIAAVSATLHVDPALAASLTGQNACYRGAAGSTDTCELVTGVDAATGAPQISVAERDLAPQEGVTVAIGFTAGTFVQGVKTQPEPREFTTDAPLWSTILAALVAAIALALTVAAVVFAVRRRRDEPGRHIIVPQYSVPEGLNVMVAAHLVSRGQTAIPAQLVSLAVRRNLRILDYPTTADGAEYGLQFLTADGADQYELALLTALFGVDPEAGAVRELTPDDETLGASVNAVSESAKASLASTALTGKRGTAGLLVPVFAVLTLVGAIFVQVATLIAFSLSPWPLVGIGLALVALVVSLALTEWKAPMTARGAELRDYLRGMQVYLTLAEKDRFRMLQSPDGAERVDIGDTSQIVKLYEKLLPFAVIWGVEDEWSKELEVKVAEQGDQPDWFAGQRGFGALAFTSALSGVSHAATYTPPSTSSSWTSGSGGGSSFGSSFGGSSGGGFSGGGGGGGGMGGR